MTSTQTPTQTSTRTSTGAAPPPTPGRGDRRSNRAVLKRAAAGAGQRRGARRDRRVRPGRGDRGLRGGPRAAGAGRHREDVHRVHQGRHRTAGPGSTSCRRTASSPWPTCCGPGPDRLAAVPGIGEGTARKVVGAADQLRARGARLAAVPHRATTRTMPTAPGCCRRWRCGARCATPPRRTRTEAAELAEAARRERPVAAGRRRAGSAACSSARGGAGPPIRRASADRRAGRPGRVQRPAAGRAGRPRGAGARAPAEVWRDFERRSAAYYGLLGQVVAARRRRRRGRGLPAGRHRRAGQRPAAGHVPAHEQLRLRGLPVLRRPVRAGAAPGRSSATRWGWARRSRPSPTMAHLAANGATHFLVVCPASVLINWTREVAAALDAAGGGPARRRPGPGDGAAGGGAAASR